MGTGIARGALYLLQAMWERQGTGGLRNVTIALVSAFSGVVLLLCVLTSPIEFVGSLGEFQAQYSHLVAPKDSVTNGEPVTDEALAALAAGITDPDRKALIEAALSLVGRLPYFWGGKSGPGWNEEWNTLKLVTAPGSSTSGTLRPYGMDCSGCATRS